jgi:hypothetical protein
MKTNYNYPAQDSHRDDECDHDDHSDWDDNEYRRRRREKARDLRRTKTRSKHDEDYDPFD